MKIKKHFSGGLRAFAAMFIACLVANVFFETGQIIHKQHIKSQHIHEYVQYYSVEPDKDAYEVGEDIFFISDSERSRVVDVQWNDILFCDDNFDGTFTWFVNYPSQRDAAPIQERKQLRWKYGFTVNFPAQCYLDSTTTIIAPYDIHKSLNLRSKVFDVGVE